MASADEALAAAQEQFAQGEYQEGVRILKHAAGDRGLPAGERAAAMVALARFYETQVGDVTRAIAGYRRALKITAGGNAGELAQLASRERDRLIELEKADTALNTEVRRMKTESFQRIALGDSAARRHLATNIDRLTHIIDTNPDYYRLHEVYYTLGLTHLTLRQPYRAVRAFNRALATKPAMVLAQPVKRLADKSRAQWLRQLGHQSAWSTCGLLLVMLAVGGARAKPWRWLRANHLFAGLAVVILYGVLFTLAHRHLAGTDAAGRLINSDNVYSKPVFIHLATGDPGSEVAQQLFIYGLVAVAGSFFFAVASGRRRRRGIALLLNIGFALLLSASLSTLFYLSHCDAKGRYYAASEASAMVPSGYLAFPMNDPEPYLLINPLYYKGLDLSSVDDPVLIDWLESYQIESGEH